MRFVIENKKRSMIRTLTCEERFEVKSRYDENITTTILIYAMPGDTVSMIGFMPFEKTIDTWMNEKITFLNVAKDESWDKVHLHFAFEFKRKALLEYYLAQCRKVASYYKEKSCI